MTVMMQAYKSWLLALVVLPLGACATPALDTSGVDTSTTPLRVASDLESTRGRKVLWGGVIVATKNHKDQTEIEVLAYPTNRSGKPNLDTAPSQRFLALNNGYLEPADYAQGRLLTVVGTVKERREGKVGEARYVYPGVRADQIHLWPKEGAPRTDPQIHFGIGVIFH